MQPGFQSQSQHHISLLLVLSFAPRGFFQVLRSFPLLEKLFKFQFNLERTDTFTRGLFPFFFSFFFSLLCEPGNRENRNAFYPHPACQVDKGRLPRHFSFRPSVTGCLNVKESGCTLHKPLTINRIFGIGIACRVCETGKISDGITGIQKPYWGWVLHMKVALEQKSDSLRSRA